MDIFQDLPPVPSENLPKDDVRQYLSEVWQLLFKQDDLGNYLIKNPEYREVIVNKLLESFKSDNHEGGISNKCQSNIILSLKIISIYLINNLNHSSSSSDTNVITYIIDILISLIPDVLDFTIFIDLLTDLARASTLSIIFLIVDHVYNNLNDIKRCYDGMEILYPNKRKIQAAGAKLIFFVKSIENRMVYTDFISYPQLSYRLRCLLVECLPISHLGISNKQGLQHIQTTFATTEPEAFKFLEDLVKRPSCETMENFADDITPEYKYKLSNFEPILKLPSYKIYTSYKIALSFSQFSLDLNSKDETYWSELLESYQNLFNFYRTINPSIRIKGPLCAWYKDGIDRGNGIIFSMVCNNIDFWKQFIVESFMALMDLYRVTKPLEPSEEFTLLFNRISHVIFQPDKDSIYSKKPTKTRAIINELQKILVKFSTRINGFMRSLTTLLATEAQWVYWKRKGCIDLLEKNTPNVNDTTMVDPNGFVEKNFNFVDNYRDSWTDWLKTCLESEESFSKRVAVQKDDGGIERLSRKTSHRHPLKVDPIDLDREANDWGLDITLGEGSLGDKLNTKLGQYREKMKIDLDPENQVETPSCENNIFRFRLGRLFNLHYMDRFVNSSCKLPVGNTCDNMEQIMSLLDQASN